MGILKFLRKKGPGSPRRSKKGPSDADGELPTDAATKTTAAQKHGTTTTTPSEPPQDATSSTEPESTHHPEEEEEDGDYEKKVTKTGNSTKVGGAVATHGGKDASLGGSDLQIVPTPLTERTGRPNDKDQPHSASNDKSVLEKFKAKSPPVPRGSKVAERTAWLQNAAFKDQGHHATAAAENGVGKNPPASREMAAEKKKFWEGKTLHPDTSSETPAMPIRVKTDVQATKKWLETVAFTPSGGGNMEETQDEEELSSHAKRKHTIGLLPSSPNVSGSSEEAASPELPRHSAKDLLQVIESMEEQQRATKPIVFLDKKDDPYEQTYETWFRNGLLSWRTSTYAGVDDTVYPSLTGMGSSSSSSPSSFKGKPLVSKNAMETPKVESNVLQEEGSTTEEPSKEKSVQLDIQVVESEAETKGGPPEQQTMSALLSLASSKDAKSYTFASLDSSEDPLQTESSLQAESQSILAPNSMDDLSTTMVVNLDLGAAESSSPTTAVSDTPSKEEYTESTPSDSLSSAASPGSLEGASTDPAVEKDDSNGNAVVENTTALYESIDDGSDQSEEVHATTTGGEAVVETTLPDDSVADGAMEPEKAIEAVRRAISMQGTESSGDLEITIADSQATEDFIESEMMDSAFVDDDDDEDFKELFQLQQQILQDMRNRPVETASDSDDELDEGRESAEVGPAGMETDDVSETTDSSQKLVDYSKKYFNTGPNKSMDVDVDSVAESGVHLEPSIVSQASSITADEMSFGDGIHFTESLDGRMFDVSMESTSFELLNDLQPHKEMNGSSNSKSMLFVHGESKDHSPVQPSRKRSNMGDNFGDQSPTRKETRRLSADHAPAQPSRKVSVDGPEHLFRGTHTAGPSPSRSPASSITTSPTDHAPARPIRQASVEDGVMIPEREMVIKPKQDSPPTTPVRVASRRNIQGTDGIAVSDSLRKARARKLAVATRGRYVMWLTRSRAINFRKSSSAPQISWFGFEEEEEIIVERAFDDMKQRLRQYISPTRRRTESEALERLKAAKSMLSSLMRRPFVHARKNTTFVVPAPSAKRAAPVLTPFLSVPPRLQKKLSAKPKVQVEARWTFV